MNKNKTLDISWETILKLAITGLIFYLLYLVKDILVWLVFALVISILFNPAIDFLKKFLPRAVAVSLVYLAVVGILGFSLYLVVPIFIFEIKQFIQFFPEYFEKISPVLKGLGMKVSEDLESFIRTSEISKGIFGVMRAIFGGIFSTFAIFVIAFFLSCEEKGIERAIRIFSPKKYEAIVLNIWEKSQRKVSGWFLARFLCCLFVGLMNFLACYILNIKYAVSFGFLSGIFNFIPIIGPIISGTAMAIIIAADSWLKAIFFLIAFTIIQQIEGTILNSVLTNKFIGLPPALVSVSLLIGGELWGVMGALLLIPIAGILFEFIRDFLKRKKEEKVVIL